MIRKLLAVALLATPAAAMCQTTTTYTYDALGRLVGAGNTGQSSTNTAITYDAAGNRVTYKVTGAPNSASDPSAGAGASGTRKFVVVPLNGFTIIPLG